MSEQSDGAAAPAHPSPDDGQVADRYDALLVDLDGVVYRGDDRVPEAAPALAAARDRGLRLLFLTNNSSRTAEGVAEKLAGAGVPAEAGDVLTSGAATAALLERSGEVRTAFVIGEEGVRGALAAAGIRVLDGEPDRADAVVVGWDRSVDYPKLRTAALLVQRGARLIATNADRTYPAPDGLWPGAGSILAAVIAATGAIPTVVGKPHRPLFEAAAERTGAARPLVIGDRLDTDVDGAEAMGWDSLLVLTGASRLSDLIHAGHGPTFVAESLRVLGEDVPPARFRSAEAADAPRIRALLEASGLSSDGVEDRLSGTLVSASAPNSGVDGTSCLEIVDGHGLVRSVAVRPGARGRGLGALAVAAAARAARSAGVRHLTLFTRTTPGFYRRLGFRAAANDALPVPVRDSRQAREECAGSATAMVAELRESPQGAAQP